jgi:hypothetical protein
MKNPPNDLTVFEFKNEKQNFFYDTVMKAVGGLLPYRHFFYGGAIRGGKTYVCLYILIQLCKYFPGSRWHVVRESMPKLESTAIISMEKLIGTTGDYFKWKRKAGNYHVAFNNGSKIFFISESLQSDKDLNKFLGLETNGVLLEQMEELSEALIKRIIERLGSWYITPMPIPILMGTVNPTRSWPKQYVYERNLEGLLKANEIYVDALPDDNPFVTAEQWENWKNLDDLSYNQMIGGSWDFPADGNLFAYKFNKKYHVLDITKPENEEFFKIDKRLPVKLIFDFNVDPITCLVCQNEGMKWGKIIDEYRLRNSDIFELLERVNEDYGQYFLVVSGDASGRNRTAITRGNKSYVIIIKEFFNLSEQQLHFPKENPSVRNTRVLMNSVFNKHGNFFISSKCMWLIKDLETVKTDDKGEIEKKTSGKGKLLTHLLDNCRYFLWNYFKSFINSYS